MAVASLAGQIAWRHLHDKRDDAGEIIDRFSICEPATQSAEGDLPNARYWYARCGRKLRKGISPDDELREIRSALKG